MSLTWVMKMNNSLVFIMCCNNCEYYNESFCSTHNEYKNLNEYCIDYHTRNGVTVDIMAHRVTGDEFAMIMNEVCKE